MPQKYKDYYRQLDEEIKRAMPEWDIRVEQARDKPRIGAFEITLVRCLCMCMCVFLFEITLLRCLCP